MKFTKFFLVVAFIFAVVGSSVAAPVVGAVANKAAQVFGQEATEKAIVRVLGKEALIKVSNKMGEHALKSAVKKEAAKKAAEEAAKKTAQKAAEKAAAKLAAKEASEKAAEETAKKAAQKAAEKAAIKEAAEKAAEEGGKQISKKKVVAGVIGTGAVAGTGVWGFNQFNQAGAQPVEEQPTTE